MNSKNSNTEPVGGPSLPPPFLRAVLPSKAPLPTQVLGRHLTGDELWAYARGERNEMTDQHIMTCNDCYNAVLSMSG